jgi:glycosyltransferase involved in cell wall biosynthesis
VIAALAWARPEVLHIQYQTGAFAMHPAINLLPWRLHGLPNRPAVAVTAHDLLPPYLFPKAGPLRGWVTRRLLADADAVVVTNAADLEQVVGGWGLGARNWEPGSASQSLIAPAQSPLLIPIGSNIAVAPPSGYDRATWRARLGVADGEMLVAYFGLVSRTKGLDTLLGALGRLPGLPLRLLIVGGAATAPEDRAFAAAIERQIAELGLQRRVLITGHCPEQDVSAHLLAADLAVLPFADGASFRRGSLLAVLAHGLPTATTYPSTDQGRTTKDERLNARNIGSSSLVLGRLADGENALLVPPGDEPALAEAIEWLATDGALRERLAAGGRALAARFDWQAIAVQHEALYARLTRPGPATDAG